MEASTALETRADGRPQKETAKAIKAFTDYILLGDNRSLSRLTEHYLTQKASGARVPTISLNALKKWSYTWHWQERLAVMARDAARKAELEEQERWAQERAAHRNRMVMVGKGLLTRAEEMLRWPIAEREVDTETGKVTLAPARWTMGDVPRFSEAADKIMRLALEMETDRATLTIEDIRRAAQEVGADPEEIKALIEASQKGDGSLGELAERIANGKA